MKAYALNKLANLRKEWSYSELALKHADRALVINPDDDIALTSKGWALIDLGKASEAVNVLEHATRANPSNEYAWYNLAWAQYLTGNPQAASHSIAKALAIDTNNPIIRHGKDMMAKGRIPTHLKKQNALPC